MAETTSSATAAGDDDRSPADIEADIEATRDRLAGTIDQIGDRVSPKNVAARAQASAKAQVVDPGTGSPRIDRIAVVAGVVVLIVVVRVYRARRRSRR